MLFFIKIQTILLHKIVDNDYRCHTIEGKQAS